MDKFTTAMLEMLRVDELSSAHSFIHDLHPLAKLLVSILYIMVVVSYPIYAFSALLPMVLFPLMLSILSGIPLSLCLKRMRMLLLLVCAVGIWNPILDRQAVLTLGPLVMTRGMLSFITLMCKGCLTLFSSFLLIATTNIEKICYALRLLRVPSMIVTLILMTFRYISLLLEEAGTMMEAYQLRAPGQNGLHIQVWGSFLGQLLLRSMDRATEVYESMMLRGFRGDFYYARVPKAALKDYLYLFFWLVFFFFCRLVHVPVLLGNLFVL